MKPTLILKLDLLLPTKLLDHPPPTPSRLLTVPGVHNIRDLGGLPTRHGRIKHSKLFRSAQPGSITPAGADVLRKLGISTIFDLRSTGESDTHDSSMRVTEVAGIRRVAAPVFSSRGVAQGAGKSTKSRCESYAMGEIGFRKEYRDILTAGGDAFRPILLHLRDGYSGCLFHCTLGRDRTGILAAVILTLVGVDDATIEMDYCLSEQGLKDWRPALEGILWRKEPGVFGVEEVRNIFSVSADQVQGIESESDVGVYEV
ncbi:hypothetical protein P170DRAFT_426103 [Aspergillus steynii IBT 23096]|uniref:Tyrosine specific protein phosphatases domain-containing protein n=1 Tax=Aspergillus steynii IBT 23096 TaxID=1392250 RepID=A0A2I2G8D1_9EURO|nr:uncharacterized protein P170DRAFT_426103 [Aspergillus steynii IBT 23096]PLB49132.1 hypothetical protein P170DRAFT_426103 [Aspergillus steynii IBT 23096]